MNDQIEIFIKYRLSRADESLQEAEMLADSGHWNTCVNRLYYACFYAVSAFLLKNDMSSSKHSGIRSFFNSHFVKPEIVPKETARIYNFLFERRQEGDYEDMALFTGSEVVPWMKEAKLFVNVLKAFIEKK